MKNLFYTFACILLISTFTGCYDQSVPESKEGVAKMPEVTGLTVSLSGNVATLTWGIPTNISPLFNRPVSVIVQVYRFRPGVTSPVRVNLQTLTTEATTASYTIPADAGNYYAVVKLRGYLKEPVWGYSSEIWSLGQNIFLITR